MSTKLKREIDAMFKTFFKLAAIQYTQVYAVIIFLIIMITLVSSPFPLWLKLIACSHTLWAGYILWEQGE